MINLTLVQSNIIWEDIDANLKSISGMLGSIAEPTDIILLPELFTTGFTMRSRDLAEPMEGRTMAWMSEKAVELKFSIAGSIIVKEGGNYFNRLIWMEEGGSYQFYDKRHLFRMSGEEQHYSRGGDVLLVDFRGTRIMPLICYDLRFPVWSRNRHNYDILVYIANWPAPRKEVWETLLKARAIENLAYVIGINRIGKDGMGIEYSGDTMAFDARGRKIASMGTSEAGLRNLRLSTAELNDFREKFPAWKDADTFTMDT
jgi:predicted amidohydrolase